MDGLSPESNVSHLLLFGFSGCGCCSFPGSFVCLCKACLFHTLNLENKRKPKKGSDSNADQPDRRLDGATKSQYLEERSIPELLIIEVLGKVYSWSGFYLWTEGLGPLADQLIWHDCYLNLNCADGGDDGLGGRVLKDLF